MGVARLQARLKNQYTGRTLILPRHERTARRMPNKALTCTPNINFSELASLLK